MVLRGMRLYNEWCRYSRWKRQHRFCIWWLHHLKEYILKKDYGWKTLCLQLLVVTFSFSGNLFVNFDRLSTRVWRKKWKLSLTQFFSGLFSIRNILFMALTFNGKIVLFFVYFKCANISMARLTQKTDFLYKINLIHNYCFLSTVALQLLCVLHTIKESFSQTKTKHTSDLVTNCCCCCINPFFLWRLRGNHNPFVLSFIWHLFAHYLPTYSTSSVFYFQLP